MNSATRMAIISPWAALLIFLAVLLTAGANETWASSTAEDPSGKGPPGAKTDEATTEKQKTGETKSLGKEGFPYAMRALAAALAVGLCALATGFAQARIGAAGMGTIAEKPELAGRVILLVAIPETLVILGFVIATLIIL